MAVLSRSGEVGETDGSSAEAGVASSSDLKKTLTGGQQVMKYILIGLSVVYLIFGAVLCALGSYATTGTASALAGQTLPKGLIAIGVFLMFTAILGIISAVREWRIGLGIYFVLMSIWTVILIAIGIAVVAEQSNIRNLLATGWEYADPGLQNGIQQTWNCCGRYGFTDTYTDAYGMALNNGHTYPAVTLTNGIQPCNTLYYNTGCVDALNSSLQSNFSAAGSAGIAFAVIMFIGLAFTCFLMRGIQNKGYSLAIEKNRMKTQKDLAERRQRGKGGLKIPDTVL